MGECQRGLSNLAKAESARAEADALRKKFQGTDISPRLLTVVALAFGAVILLGTGVLIGALQEYRSSQNQFRQMASNIREIFWTIDAKTRRALYVNEAYETITHKIADTTRNSSPTRQAVS